ncbi:MAG: hypothetical protein RI897_1473 [Verrucomicrobiota bacterium]
MRTSRILLGMMCVVMGVGVVGAGGWEDIFNGQDMAGWRENRFAHEPRWEVKDGVLVGRGGQGYLVTEGEYGDFELEVEVRIWDEGDRRGNSGVYIRCQPHENKGAEYPPGYEVQCDHFDQNNPTGSIYNLGEPGSRAPMPAIRDGEWFTMRVVAQGNHLRTWVNGKVAVDCTDTKSRYMRGSVLLQMHHRTGVVEFRKVRIRKLELVEAACGECLFGMPGNGCDLAVRVGGEGYFVDGVDQDGLGDAHAEDGICNAVRRAWVAGEVRGGRFEAGYFELGSVVKE